MIFNKQQHDTKKFTTLWNKANLLKELLGIPYAKYACTSLNAWETVIWSANWSEKTNSQYNSYMHNKCIVHIDPKCSLCIIFHLTETHSF